MKFLVLLAIVAFAHGAPSKFNYVPIMPRLPTLPNAPHYEGGSSKIVGGQVASVTDWPWQVYIIIDGGSFCGGTLIDRSTVMTAAHCTTGAKSIEVNLGASSQIDSHTRIDSSKIITHEDYAPVTINNDIGLVILSTPATTSSTIQVAKYQSATDNRVGAGVSVTATGFGKPSDDASGTSINLREVTTTTISNAVCQETYGALNVNDNKVCIDASAGKGTCNGDSGGPLHLTSDKTVIGITSFGSSAGCESGAPDAFTRVGDYANWIDANK